MFIRAPYASYSSNYRYRSNLRDRRVEINLIPDFRDVVEIIVPDDQHIGAKVSYKFMSMSITPCSFVSSN